MASYPNRSKGLLIIAEYLKISGLNYAPADFAKMVSSAGDAFLNNLGNAFVIGLDGDTSRLEAPLTQIYKMVGKKIPNSSMFFEAIYAEANENQTWDAIKYGVVEGLKDAGTEISKAAENTAAIVKLLNTAAPFIVLVFVGGFLYSNYKKLNG